MENQYVIKNNRVGRQLYQESPAIRRPEELPLYERFRSEGSEDFFNFLEWIGLANYPDILILSSSHHYYYDAEDMENIKALVNLKKINEIKHVKAFLNNIYDIIPDRSYFLGCFRDINDRTVDQRSFRKIRKQQEVMAEAEENAIASSIPFVNMIYNILDQKTNRNMTRTYVRLLLKEAGFSMLDITDLNGLTYFCVQKGPTVTE
ncbi:MAG: hypothetical protein LC649_02495 [Bacteroidales bacterium]|nr:hypothetical protein [Bacteroidales bacterium]